MPQNDSKLSTNEILYRSSKALKLSEEDLLQTYKLENFPMDAKGLKSLLARRQDKHFKACSYEELGVFLDGLVSLKRGPSPKKEEPKEALSLSNNLILKKLRIAAELKEAETEIIFSLANITLSKQQLSSLFRNEKHKNFKVCSDVLLLAFLDGLDEFYFSGVAEFDV
ncbi:MAG: DUF1456 domain-containing protein [Gammaproteobacteria bacterium]|nr:MAG: DUF1456 domain-containing protein [Gammaproteobacteria bacterium]